MYDWLQDLLTLTSPAWATESDIRERLDVVMRFQQITGPVTAKGFEDTVLYRWKTRNFDPADYDEAQASAAH